MQKNPRTTDLSPGQGMLTSNHGDPVLLHSCKRYPGIALFVCLAIAGSAVATVHYVAIDLPARDASDLQPPENAYWVKCKNCQLACSYDPNPVECLYHCDLIC